MKKTMKGILWGLVLILIGVAIALNALDIEFSLFFDGWWTLFIIVPCSIELFTEKNKTASLIGLLVGIGLLLAARDIITYGAFIKLIVPVILILIGIYVIFRTLVRKPAQENVTASTNFETQGKTDSEYTAIFSGEKINFDGRLFCGTTLTAVFGSIKCDLRGAVIEHDVILSTTAAFGSAEILLPPTVHINIDSSSAFLGDVSNRAKSTPDPIAPTVTIRPTCIFGSVVIK